jgi:hypothetical protein
VRRQRDRYLDSERAQRRPRKGAKSEVTEVVRTSFVPEAGCADRTSQTGPNWSAPERGSLVYVYAACGVGQWRKVYDWSTPGPTGRQGTTIGVKDDQAHQSARSR